MTLLFQDGFDHYANSTSVAASYTEWSANGSNLVAAGYLPQNPSAGLIYVGTGYGKVPTTESGGAISCGLALGSNNGDYVWLKRNLPAWQNRIVVGFAVRLSAALNTSIEKLRIFEFTSVLGVAIKPTSHILEVFGQDTSAFLEVGVWYYMEIAVDVVSGEATLWLSGEEIFSTVVDPQISVASMHIMAKRIGASGSNQSFIIHIDDLYILDGSGTINTQRLGKVHCVLRRPTKTDEIGMRSYSASVANHNALSEVTPDGDSSYVSANVNGQHDLYSNANALLTDKRIFGVSIISNVKKEEPDLIDVKPVIKSGSVIAEGNNIPLLANAYTGNIQTFETDPATGLRWTKAGVEASKWGQKVITPDTLEILEFGPGAQTLLAGDSAAGFYGELASDKLITYANLYAALLGSTSAYTDMGWLKFSSEGKILFVAKSNIANSSWGNLYANGLVYGIDGVGAYPYSTQTNQLRIVNIGGYRFKVRLLKGADSDPSTGTTSGSAGVPTHLNSEWTKLVRQTHSDAGVSSWANYSDSDLPTSTPSLCQETRDSNSSYKVYRGGDSINTYASPTLGSSYGWRPVLELLPPEGN